jgi:hypothetical protein
MEFAGGQRDARRVGRLCIQVCDPHRSLLPGHSSVQDERRRQQAVELRLDGMEVFRPSGQDQNLASLRDGIAHLGGDSLGP